jgi:DNA polymerase (family 10)
MTLSNREVADIFAAVADSMEILGEDKFRSLAYRRAAEAIADLPMPLRDYQARNALEDIPGIGKTIAEKIATILDTGQLPLYERLKTQVSPGLLELLQVPDLGPRSVARLSKELNISSVADLRAAIADGRLRALKGFGAKSEARIAQGLAEMEGRQRRIIMPNALQYAEGLIAALREAAPTVEQLGYAGSLRRATPTTGDIDLLAGATDSAALITAFTTLPQVARVEAQGDIKASVILQSGMRADLLVVPPQRWGSALQHFTGSKDHNIHFRRLAQERDLSFSENGFARNDGSLIECADETAVYAVLDLPFIAPELREDNGEFAAAQAGKLPNLVGLDDMRADLHMHSTWSDGQASIAAMAAAAEARGLHYIAITDHSAYLGVTGGVDAERLKQQAVEVAALNAEYEARGSAFRILHGVEVDITPDGTLALSDDVLAQLDIVVASLHVSLRQERAQVTARLLRAIENPHVDIIAHPTGRILERRAGADLDMEQILPAAVAAHKLLEVNSGPDRLDLDAVYVRRALELGAYITINSDAHHPSDLAWLRYGVLTARRGWAAAERVVNTWPLDQLRSWLAQR